MTRPLPSAEGKPLVIAHRGASAYRPENTLAAFELAIEQDADMIETDLHTTSDGVVAISHDATLDHLGGEGEVADKTLAELQALDAGDGERVPTLDEVMDRFSAQIPFNLELKIGTAHRYADMEQAAIDAAHSRGVMDQTLYSSFYDGVLRRLRELEASVRIAVLVDYKQPERMFERAAECGAEAINPFFSQVDTEFMARAHGEGLAVYPYTVDDLEAMERLLDLGVDGLFTNRPDCMRELLKKRAK